MTKTTACRLFYQGESMQPLIDPRVLKGFRDFLPETETQRQYIIHQLEKTFTRFGFVPIDTPALEYADVLLGKGGGETDKQIYRFLDHGNRDVALRFDLTVPFARFMAAHENELYLPFKRYHIAKVWRGENTQRGRYREFMQCDFDIVGVDSASADFEILLVIKDSMETLNIPNFVIHISHRGIFGEYLKQLGLETHITDILRTVDKLGKIGEEKVKRSLCEIIGETKTDSILSFIHPEKTIKETFDKLRTMVTPDCHAMQRMGKIVHYIEELQLEHMFVLNPSITRGLDYYTGIVCETFLSDNPNIGSVCSGGRYNDLASLYTKQQIPGVGASFGLDRLLAAIESLDSIKARSSSVDILIICMEEGLTGYYHGLAQKLQKRGFSCEVYPEQKKLGKQFNYAEKKGIPSAIIVGEDEKTSGTVTCKDLDQRRNYENLSFDEAISVLQSIVSH
jgi:histidyl-tRNA synthetase